MTEKSDSREEHTQGMEGQSQPELPIASGIDQIFRMVRSWFKPPKRTIPFWERLLYGWLGSATFFVFNFYLSYYSEELAVRVAADGFQIVSLFSGIVSLAACGILFALLVSIVRGRSGPIRLYFSGFFVVYVPWALLSQWI